MSTAAAAAGAFHGAQLTLSGNWTSPSNGYNAVDFDTTTYDTDGYRDAVPLDHQFVIPAGLGGVYLCAFGGHLSSIGTSPIASLWRGSNDRFGSAPLVTAGSANDFTVLGTAQFAAGQPVTAQMGKTAGTLTVEGANGFFPAYFSISLLGTP